MAFDLQVYIDSLKKRLGELESVHAIVEISLLEGFSLHIAYAQRQGRIRLLNELITELEQHIPDQP